MGIDLHDSNLRVGFGRRWFSSGLPSDAWLCRGALQGGFRNCVFPGDFDRIVGEYGGELRDGFSDGALWNSAFHHYGVRVDCIHVTFFIGNI